MKLSSIHKEERQMLKRRALALSATGLTTYEIGTLLGRSHTWASWAIKEMRKELNIPVDPNKKLHKKLSTD